MNKKRWDYSALKTKQPHRLAIWQVISLLMILGLTIGLMAMAGASSVYKNSLRTRAHTIAEALSGRQITTLKTAASDSAAQADTAYVKDKLARIKSANADARFVYIMARDVNGQIYFLADSEEPGSDGYSARGEPYPEASPQLKAMFDNGRLLVEGPSADSYGSWLSALAPVVDEQDYRLVAVVGIDIPATTYGLLLGLSGGIPLLLALVASTFIYIRYQQDRRHREHVQFRAEMISIASHELRTPLTGLRWSVESLLNHKVPADKQQRSLEIMYDSTLRLEESIEDVLQLASLESGKAQRLHIKETNLRDMLEDIMAMQKLAADRHDIGMSFDVNWPKELLIAVDAQRMKRVFHNLISNAVKYSKPGTAITLTYRFDHIQGHIISIKDQGIGIPALEQGKVWDGYYRATNTDAHDIHGTGMGLYLSRTIIEQHGGHIWLESQEGKGTTVYVALPDVAEPAAQTPPLQTRGK